VSWARALAFNFVFFSWTAIIGTLGLPFLLAPRAAAMRFGRFWAKSVLVLLKLIVGLSHEIRGLDRIPRGGCIIAMKHQSAWDTLVLPVVLGDPAIVLKRELLLLPFYGWYAARAGSIAINRKAGAGAMRRMLAQARAPAVVGRPIEILNAADNRDIDASFATLQKRAAALLVPPDSLFLARRVHLVGLTLRHAVPVLFPWREAVEIGGLMSYGPSFPDGYRQVGLYTGRILKGEKPGDLPVLRPSKFELIINLQTAKTLGLDVAPTLLGSADEVIE